MKVKVLDTNVFLDRNIQSIFESFTEPTTVIIPHVVLKELDTFKKGFEMKNEYARAATRFLDALRKEGNLQDGVMYEEHLVKVDINMNELDLSKPDYEIIHTAYKHKAELVTQDINERVVGDALGLEVSNYEPENVDVNNLYTGWKEIEITDEEAKAWHECGYDNESIPNQGHELLNNQFVVMKIASGGELEGVYKEEQNRIFSLIRDCKAWGISPRNREQRFLFHSLLDPTIHIVTAIGPSGCGKTLVTFAASLRQTFEEADGYNRIMAMRPLVAVGDDIGFLPGDKLEKLEPWMASTFDAFDYLLDSQEVPNVNPMLTSKEKMYALVQMGKLELEAMAHIRGRSIPNQFIVVDDAQNLTRHQATTIITRAGEGTKMILLGDLSEKQIDNPRLTPNSNGLAYVIDKLKGKKIVSHITLETVVRSPLAQLGVELL